MALPPRFDPSDPAVLDDPYPVYSALRAAGPIARGTFGQIVVTRFHDVAAGLRSTRLSNEFPEKYRRVAVGDGPASDFLSRVLLHRDPPAHRALRGMLAAPLLTLLPRLTERARELASELVDNATRAGRCDAVMALALQLPFLIICELLCVPAADRDALRPYSLALSRAFTPRAADDDRAAANAAVAYLRSYICMRLSREAEDGPGTELLAAAREARRGIDAADVIDNLVFLLFAGFETTTNLIANAIALLLAHPEARERLRDDEALVQPMIEECLRFDPPIQSRARVAVEPIRIGDREVRPGRVVLLLLGSANRDPAVFERPDEFDITRSPNPHLGFGAGPHHCLGAQLARIEAAALFTELLRARELAGDGPLQRDRASVFRAYRSIPLRLR